jgi:nucleoid-associated protein YejK
MINEPLFTLSVDSNSSIENVAARIKESCSNNSPKSNSMYLFNRESTNRYDILQIFDQAGTALPFSSEAAECLENEDEIMAVTSFGILIFDDRRCYRKIWRVL